MSSLEEVLSIRATAMLDQARDAYIDALRRVEPLLTGHQSFEGLVREQNRIVERAIKSQ